MTVEALFETVIKPLYNGELLIQEEREIVYSGYPKEKRIYAWLMVKEVEEIYPAKDGELLIVV
ncbi:hypothetical protein P4K96_04155 [Bacillus cereus]|nr:hypothetical protein [Bacillus cereus]